LLLTFQSPIESSSSIFEASIKPPTLMFWSGDPILASIIERVGPTQIAYRGRLSKRWL
jgi:hypothetical protein